jgi:hypothetical protein
LIQLIFCIKFRIIVLFLIPIETYWKSEKILEIRHEVLITLLVSSFYAFCIMPASRLCRELFWIMPARGPSGSSYAYALFFLAASAGRCYELCLPEAPARSSYSICLLLATPSKSSYAFWPLLLVAFKQTIWKSHKMKFSSTLCSQTKNIFSFFFSLSSL